MSLIDIHQNCYEFSNSRLKLIDISIKLMYNISQRTINLRTLSLEISGHWNDPMRFEYNYNKNEGSGV